MSVLSKAIISFTATVFMTATAATLSTQANAGGGYRHSGGHGGAIAAGVLGGIILGNILNNANREPDWATSRHPDGSGATVVLHPGGDRVEFEHDRRGWVTRGYRDRRPVKDYGKLYDPGEHRSTIAYRDRAGRLRTVKRRGDTSDRSIRRIINRLPAYGADFNRATGKTTVRFRDRNGVKRAVVRPGRLSESKVRRIVRRGIR